MKQLEVDIVRVEEPWSKAYLPDGTVVKVKLVFTKILRVLDEDGKPAFGPDGAPAYFTMHNFVGAVDAPESAMRKSEPVKG